MASAKVPLIVLDQNKKGLAILMGNDYTGTPSFHSDGKIKTYGALHGTKNDIKLAEQVFSSFGGQCVLLQNETAEGIKALIAEAASIAYPPSYEWIVVLFTGHGSSNDALIANDGKAVYMEPDIIGPFQPERAQQIAKLKKLFFVDACRGDNHTKSIVVPANGSKPTPQISRGGEPVRSMKFPEKANIMIAYSTLQDKISWGEKEKGVWIQMVLTRLQTDLGSSVTDTLQEVNKDLLELYQDKLHLQQPFLVATLVGKFVFEKPSASAAIKHGDVHTQCHDKLQQQPQPQEVPTMGKFVTAMASGNRGILYTSELSTMVKEKKIKKREYTNSKKSNHVQLIVRFDGNKKQIFNSEDYGSSFTSHNEAQEKVAEKAVHFIRAKEAASLSDTTASEPKKLISKCSSTPSGTTVPKNVKPEINTYGLQQQGTLSKKLEQEPPNKVKRVKSDQELELKRISTIKNTEILQELKNVVVDRGKYKIFPENYAYTEEQSGNFICKFSHHRFPHIIVGEPRKSKQEAKQSVAREVLKYYYKNLAG